MKLNDRRTVLRLLLLSALVTAAVGLWTWSSLDTVDREWRVVNEYGMTVSNPEHSFPFLYWVGNGISEEDANGLLAPFDYRLEPVEEAHLSDSRLFPALVLCALVTLVFAVSYGVTLLTARRERMNELSPTKPCPTSEPSRAPTAELDSREERLANLRRLYDAGILSREEFDERRKRL